MSLPPRRIATLLWFVLALAVMAAFIAVAVDDDIYAPGARAGHLHAGLGIYDKLPPWMQHDLSYRHVLRKVYSVIAFAVVGAFVAPLATKRRRVPFCIGFVAAYSALIEVLQKFVWHSPEGLFSNAFDVGCGALGGWLGALAFERLATRLPGRAALLQRRAIKRQIDG